ncbi:MAG: peptide ABC transporter substrate-binding protein [Caulobacteraceae bacterium]
MIGLTEATADGKVGPGMATSWETSPDGLVWTFHLRDADWSDGTPVTADDFVAGWRRLLTPQDRRPGRLPGLFHQERPGGERGQGGGERPGRAGARSPHPAGHPGPPDADAAVAGAQPVPGPDPAPGLGQVGRRLGPAGPLHRQRPLPAGELAARRPYPGGEEPRFYDADNVCFDEVRYYPVVDAISGERRVRRGELDLSKDIQSNRIAYLRRPDQIPAYVHTHLYIGVAYLEFNTKDVAAFRDKRVRQALSMAIDRQFITDKLLRGGQQPAYRFVPPGVSNREDGPHAYWAGWTLARRQAEARRLLAEAGYGPAHPLTVEIKHRNTADPTLFMPAVQADWKAVGVTATLMANEPQIAYQAYNDRDFQVADAAWNGDDDPYYFLFLHRSDTGAENYGDYRDPAYDALLDAADHEPNSARRDDDLARAEQVLLDDAPIAPIFFYINKNLVNPGHHRLGRQRRRLASGALPVLQGGPRRAGPDLDREAGLRRQGT